MAATTWPPHFTLATAVPGLTVHSASFNGTRSVATLRLHYDGSDFNACGEATLGSILIGFFGEFFFIAIAKVVAMGMTAAIASVWSSRLTFVIHDRSPDNTVPIVVHPMCMIGIPPTAPNEIITDLFGRVICPFTTKKV